MGLAAFRLCSPSPPSRPEPDRDGLHHGHPWLRVLTALPIVLITIANGAATVRLVCGILLTEPFTQQARTLLAAGGVIWLTNVIAFALCYRDLDRGGAAARALGSATGPAYLPDMSNPEHVRAGWSPAFADYLHLPSIPRWRSALPTSRRSSRRQSSR
jgi:hypothetical protein